MHAYVYKDIEEYLTAMFTSYVYDRVLEY